MPARTLAELTTFRVGGPIGALVEAADEAGFVEAIRRADERVSPCSCSAGARMCWPAMPASPVSSCVIGVRRSRCAPRARRRGRPRAGRSGSKSRRAPAPCGMTSSCGASSAACPVWRPCRGSRARSVRRRSRTSALTGMRSRIAWYPSGPGIGPKALSWNCRPRISPCRTGIRSSSARFARRVPPGGCGGRRGAGWCWRRASRWRPLRCRRRCCTASSRIAWALRSASALKRGACDPGSSTCGVRRAWSSIRRITTPGAPVPSSRTRSFLPGPLRGFPRARPVSP